MSIPSETGLLTGKRLSTFAAALVIARRDFCAILFSRSFIFFLLGPLFPVIVAMAAGSVGHKVQQAAERPVLGVAMSAADTAALINASNVLDSRVGYGLPELTVVSQTKPGEQIDARKVLRQQQGGVSALLTGTLRDPVLTGSQGLIADWQGPVSLLAQQAQNGTLQKFPAVALVPTTAAAAKSRGDRMRTAQGGQTLLFLLTMLLAGMVLSNLVEEKGNKIIEVLAAAVPMNAVFFGKLFAMLGISFVGITVWGSAYGVMILAGGTGLSGYAAPAVGWTAFIALGVTYFAMAYLLLGAMFLTLGSMASTVREVQTLSMPASMGQLMVFFFASYAMAQPGSTVELAAQIFPLSSPFAMLARAAQDGSIMPHVMALVWQAVWVTLFVRFGAQLFRRRVMKSGPQGARKRKGKLATA
ncbi:MAG: ABC transporter permease [Novosphingobium sp.]